MGLVSRYRKEVYPVMQALEDMPGERKIIVTDPQTEMVELLYNGLKQKGGGTLIILDADIKGDEMLRNSLLKKMFQASADNIGIGLYWPVASTIKD